MALSPGTRLGPYEILETRLERIVVIKILPAHLSCDPIRKQRFEREAKTISGLNHPHICVLHDVGSQNGIDYWKGVWLSLTITVTSYVGVEIITVTAGEAQHSEVSVPHAMRNIVWRLILFYVLAIAIMVTMAPWNQTSSSSALSASPFVTLFAAARIPFASSIMNCVVLTTALSSVNTNLYLSTRMLFSLGRGGYAPEWIGKVSGNGVPHRALLASTAGIIAAILLAIFAPKNAFLILYGSAVAGMLFVWQVILATHLRFRKAITRQRLLSLPMRLWAHPFFTVVGILLMLAIALTTFFVHGLEWSVPAFSVFLGLISLSYLRGRPHNAV